jgi:hypothetical protein
VIPSERLKEIVESDGWKNMNAREHKELASELLLARAVVEAAKETEDAEGEEAFWEAWHGKLKVALAAYYKPAK